MMMTPTESWEMLARQVAGLASDAPVTSYGSDMVAPVLDVLLGAAQMRAAIDCCLDLLPGYPLAELILQRCESPVAVAYCHAIFTTTTATARRAQAAWLLATIGGYPATGYVTTFLDDPDPRVQQAGVRLLARWLPAYPHQGVLHDLLARAEQRSAPGVRADVADLRRLLAQLHESAANV